MDTGISTRLHPSTLEVVVAVGHCVLQRLAGRPLSRLAHLGRRIGDPAERKNVWRPAKSHPGNTPHMRVDGAGAGKEMMSVCLSACLHATGGWSHTRRRRRLRQQAASSSSMQEPLQPAGIKKQKPGSRHLRATIR